MGLDYATQNDSRAMTLQVYPVEPRPGEPDPARVRVNMPPGADVIDVVNTGQGLGVVALHHPKAAAVRVAHDLVLLRAGDSAVPTLGRVLGSSLGLVSVLGGPCAVLPEFPWPTSALQA